MEVRDKYIEPEHTPDKYHEVARWIVLTQIPFESASESEMKASKIAQVMRQELGGQNE